MIRGRVPKILTVALPSHSYSVYVGAHALDEAAAALSSFCPNRKVVVVSDETVWETHGAKLSSLLGQMGLDQHAIVIRPGETSKSLEMLQYIYSEMYAFGLHRHDPILAFGGGVVGDLSGFAAATYMRGVPFIQIPTTLLAQVDASVGGKVAVNLPEGKNLAGCFYQPSLVIADTVFLATIPVRELGSGLAEVIKHAVIDRLLGPEIRGRLKDLLEVGSLRQVCEENAVAFSSLIQLCVQSKITFVSRDEREAGDRVMLNFGHTFGHAIEAYFGFTRYNHGEAVAVGMALAAETGRRLGVTKPGAVMTIRFLTEAAGLTSQADVTVPELVPYMLGDKKNSGDTITLVLLTALGEPVTYRITAGELERLWMMSGR